MSEGVVERDLVFGLLRKWVFVGILERKIEQGNGCLRGFVAKCFPYAMIGNHTVFFQRYSSDSVADLGEERFAFTLQPLGYNHPEEGMEGIVALPAALRFVAKVMYIVVLQPVESNPVHDASGYATHGAKDAAPAEHEEPAVGKEIFFVCHQGHLRQKCANGVGENIDLAVLFKEWVLPAFDITGQCGEIGPGLPSGQVEALRTLRDAVTQRHIGKAQRAVVGTLLPA